MPSVWYVQLMHILVVFNVSKIMNNNTLSLMEAMKISGNI